MNDTNKLVAIVTGASSGIGLGLVKALLTKGYLIVATSRSASRSKDLPTSESIITVDGDIGHRATSVAVADSAMKNFGRIDLLINNAGIFISKPFTEYTENDFQNMINTNVASFFYMSQQVIPAMQKQKSGHIVNISTSLVDQPIFSVPASLPILTKSTMSAVSRELAIEYAADG